eukprot:291264_1
MIKTTPEQLLKDIELIKDIDFNSTEHEPLNNEDKFIKLVTETGLYPYRGCFIIKVKPSPDFKDKNWFGKLKFVKSVIMTLYSLFMTLYLTFVVTVQKPEYDFLNLNPDYSFSPYYEVIWRLRYLNYFGLFQLLLSYCNEDFYDNETLNSPLMSMHPRARYHKAVLYGNVKKSLLNHILFITKSLTLTNLAVNILLLASSSQYYSTSALILLIIQTINDYFVVSDFNTFHTKFKPNGICQSIKVRLIELFTNWFVIILTILAELFVVVIVAIMIVVLLLYCMICCLTCFCCGRFNFEQIAQMFDMD